MAVNSVAVVGLGYVGLPLAIAFGKKIKTIGFDISEDKIISYRKGLDPTAEVERADFEQAVLLSLTNDPAAIKETDLVVVAVPTPITANKQPDLKYLVSASEIVGKNLKHGAIVVYESTVYPGVTEDTCGPILERVSGLKYGEEFKVGYSPERINPGDREHSLTNIVKVVAAQDRDTLEEVASTYELIVEAGVYRAESIRVAEAAKVIENTQRDLNIALMNELAIIFNRLNIDTKSVLEAACTKWNFLSFTPGLVGGHCIGVDPYYLTYCAQQTGYHPEVILAGRRINDSMGSYVAERTVKELIHARVRVEGARVVILGLTFKENCPDIRNTRVIDIVHEFREYGIEPMIHDPMANPKEAETMYGIRLLRDLPANVDAVVLAVAHKTYAEAGVSAIKDMLTPDRGVVIDVKDFYHPDDFKEKTIRYWRL
ncbi:MAG: nucleotide sugar dehydrogenase [Dissulfuribacterales bacterium]